MSDTIEQLEGRIADLIKLSESLRNDHNNLQRDYELLHEQLSAVQEKNKIAHARIEQIVDKLKSLEP